MSLTNTEIKEIIVNVLDRFEDELYYNTRGINPRDYNSVANVIINNIEFKKNTVGLEGMFCMYKHDEKYDTLYLTRTGEWVEDIYENANNIKNLLLFEDTVELYTFAKKCFGKELNWHTKYNHNKF